jgi:hypothetical protein
MPTEDMHSRSDVTKPRSARRGRSVPVDELPPRVRDRLSDELIDESLAGPRTRDEIVRPRGLLADLTRQLVEGR